MRPFDIYVDIIPYPKLEAALSIVVDQVGELRIWLRPSHLRLRVVSDRWCRFYDGLGLITGTWTGGPYPPQYHHSAVIAGRPAVLIPYSEFNAPDAELLGATDDDL